MNSPGGLFDDDAFVGVPPAFAPERLPPRRVGVSFCARAFGSGRAAGAEEAPSVRRGGANVGLTMVVVYEGKKGGDRGEVKSIENQVKSSKTYEPMNPPVSKSTGCMVLKVTCVVSWHAVLMCM